MDKRSVLLFIIILLFLVLVLPGCGATPEDFRPDDFELHRLDGDDITVQLADLDFVPVPGTVYHVLMDEGLSEDARSFFRRYVQYDGRENSVTETFEHFTLPRRIFRTIDAKRWLAENHPERLELLPQSFISDSVHSQWEQEGYDAVQERAGALTLDTIKRLGALARIGEDFVLPQSTEDLERTVTLLEDVYLPNHSNISITRELEALPLSFAYRISLAISPQGNSDSVALATINLFYKLDEMNQPLELTLETLFKADSENLSLALRQPMNATAAFAWVMHESLVEELRIYGVNKHNPELRYANSTLYYEGEEEEFRYLERYTMR